MKRHLLLYLVCFVLFLALLQDARRYQNAPPPPVSVAGEGLPMTASTLNSGENHMCLRDKTGTLWCWGNNLKGQLGNVDFALQATPRAFRFRRPFSMMEGGADHSCGLALTGQVLCWGDPAMGVMGDGGARVQPDARPATVPGLSGVVKIASGFDGSCALQASGRIFCWGTTGRSNSRQRIRVFRTASRPEPVPLRSPPWIWDSGRTMPAPSALQAQPTVGASMPWVRSAMAVSKTACNRFVFSICQRS